MKQSPMLKSVATSVSFFLISILQPAMAQVQTPRYISITSNTNAFYEYLPQGYNPANSQTYPLMIFVHGMGELGNGSPSQLPLVLHNGPPKLINQGTFPTSFTVNGQTYRFIIISPQFIAWPSSTDINNAINYATQNYHVNINKIYVTGLSMGGGVTWEYAGNQSLYANRLAALLPVCGASWPDNGRARIMATANLPVWATHNNGDPTVPVSYTNDYIDLINAPPTPVPPAKKTIFQANGHDAWTTTYDPNYRENGMNVYEWMLQYQRNFGGVNQLPIADAGADVNLTLPANSTQLNGIGSWDLDGTITTYSWARISGPTQYTLNNSNIVNPVLSNLVAGNYIFRLTVTDNQGATATDDILVKVNPIQTIPGKIEAENYFAMSGISTELTSDVGGGMNVGYIDNGDWMDYNTNVMTAGTYTVNFRVASPTSGGQIQLRKSDGTVLATLAVPQTGGWQTWATISTAVSLQAGNQTLRVFSGNSTQWNINWLDFVSVATGSNQPPVAKAGLDQVITLPANSVSLSGIASTDDHNIATYQWTKLTGSGGSLTTPASSTTNFTGLSAGVYTVELLVTDDSSAVGKDTVQVTVNAANQTPVVYAGSDQAITQPSSSVTLTGSATDADGTISTHAWSFISGPVTPSIAAASNYSTNVTGLSAAGVYTFRLTATDNSNASGSDDIVVVVNSATGGQNKTINVNLFSNNSPYNNSAWNNWDFIANPTSPAFKYSDGSSSIIYSSIKTGSDYAQLDNYITLPMCPNEVGKYALKTGFFQTIYDTLKGLDNTKTYDLSFYSSHSSGFNEYTRYVVGNDSVEINNNNNSTTPAIFTNKVPSGGMIVVKVVAVNFIAYVNGFTITEKTAGNSPPVANAGSDQAITLPVNSVTLNGSATDVDGTISTHAWSFISGPVTPSIAAVSNYSTNVTGLSAAGVYTFRLTATDNSSASGSDDIVVVNSATGGQNKTINVNLFSNNSPYNNSAWNNWDFIANPTSPAFKYSDGSSSIIYSSIKTGSDYAQLDNYITLPMCPNEVGKYALKTGFFQTIYDTLKGLDNTKTYDLSFYSSHSSGFNEYTRYVVGNDSVEINNNNNSTTPAIFTNKVPSGGMIVVKVVAVNFIAYVNGFTITEKTAIGSNMTTLAGRETDQTTSLPKSLSKVSLGIFPNPVNDQFVLQLNNNYSGAMKIQIFDQNGALRKEMQFIKNKGLTQINLSAKGLTGGTYIVRVQLGGWSDSIKMLKL